MITHPKPPTASQRNSNSQNITHAFFNHLQRVLQLSSKCAHSTSKLGKHIHQVRIETRMIQTFLNCFKKDYSKATYQKANKLLKSIRKRAGKIRNWQVFLNDWKVNSQPKKQYSTHQFILKYVLRKVHKKQKDFASFHKANKASIRKTFRKICKKQPTVRKKDFTSLAKRLIRRFKKQFLMVQRAKSPSFPRIHALRVAGKKLRYCLEILSPLLKSIPWKSNLKHLRTLQNQLGVITDKNLILRRLKSLKNKGVKNKKLDPKSLDALLAMKKIRFKMIQSALRFHDQRAD